MERYFECNVETKGYDLRITIWTARVSEVEALAKQQAAFRLKQIYGVERAEGEFKVIAIKEKRL
jgi:hypothetical protein